MQLIFNSCLLVSGSGGCFCISFFLSLLHVVWFSLSFSIPLFHFNGRNSFVLKDMLGIFVYNSM